MDTEVRLIHLYDTERHRIACGALGQSNSTKHLHGVTCSACLELAAETNRGTSAAAGGAPLAH